MEIAEKYGAEAVFCKDPQHANCTACKIVALFNRRKADLSIAGASLRPEMYHVSLDKLLMRSARQTRPPELERVGSGKATVRMYHITIPDVTVSPQAAENCQRDLAKAQRLLEEKQRAPDAKKVAKKPSAAASAQTSAASLATVRLQIPAEDVGIIED
ncbi:hypothetical protein PAPYR_12703 [Paratrimastix pyriformis]|uniref:Uncharacterized protein n=1 Tax=Paratrimastix pyriformis TaxID=342808 RepID=A0ABQ8U313_9EUKA|nr:hypothetical protein PAPYR_12703 [Paratrimastix pyriformis]